MDRLMFNYATIDSTCYLLMAARTRVGTVFDFTMLLSC